MHAFQYRPIGAWPEPLRFGGSAPPAPQPQPLPPVPALDPVQQKQAADKSNEQQLAALGGGRASTILTGPLGDTTGRNSVVKTLLGA